MSLNPKKHDTLFCLGNAHSSYAFSTPNEDEAKAHFDKSTVYFQRAVEEVFSGFGLKPLIPVSLWFYCVDVIVVVDV